MGIKVSIIGAGGHARTLINILELKGYEIKGVYDDNFNETHRGEIIESYPLIGGLEAVGDLEKVVIAKGETHALKRLCNQFASQLLHDNLIHPAAVVETGKIGNSNQISALTYLTKSSSIGSNNLIYSQSTLEHEVEIGDFNVITVNVSICGRVKIGNQCFFGASCTILPKIRICDGVTVGAGAVVTKDINEPGIYIGTPAKKIGS